MGASHIPRLSKRATTFFREELEEINEIPNLRIKKETQVRTGNSSDYSDSEEYDDYVDMDDADTFRRSMAMI